MTKVGNKEYLTSQDLPDIIPVFPLSGALLLPGGNMPLNIFEQRYLAMTDHALCTDRIIGMIQPDFDNTQVANGPKLCRIGCLGRLTGFQESGDGRYTINLTGICRFEVIRETDMRKGFRQVEFKINDNELEPSDKEADSRNHKTINRKLVLATFKRYLEANDMDTDWDAVERTDDETLITALCMMSPYGPAEKQALLEATDLNMRAETLVAITEMALAKNSDESGTSLQ